MATITRASDREREQLRRSMIAKPPAPTDKEQAGVFPFNTFLRDLRDPQDPLNLSFPFLRRLRHDHMIAMGRHFINMPLINATWYYECDLAQIAAYADNLIRPIYGDLVIAILRYLDFGFSPGCKVFDLAKPDWTYIEDGQEKKVWDNGSVDAIIYKPMIPLKPEICRPSYTDAGDFNGIEYDRRYGTSAFLIDGQSANKIDLTHAVWAINDKANEDNHIYGFPLIAHAGPIYHMFWWIWDLIGRAFENNADPGPVVRYPREDPDEIEDGEEPITNRDRALEIGQARRSGSTIALPSDPYTDFQDRASTQARKWDLEYPKAQVDFAQLQQWLGWCESAKLNALFIQEQGLIEGSGSTSNRNVASEFGQARNASQAVRMKDIDNIIDNVFVKPVISVVFPQFSGKLEKKTIGFGKNDEDMLAQAFQLAGQQNFSKFGIDLRRLAESQGFPMQSAKEYIADQEKAAAQAAVQPPPVVEPTQGRRALVTQTGFNETAYVQLGGTIVIDGDGDFVTSLPRDAHFADNAVVAGTRELRSYVKTFVTDTYKDFARFIGKRSDDELSEGAAGTWKPRAERVVGLHGRLQTVMTKIFDRAADIQSIRLGVQDRPAAPKDWIEEQASRTVVELVHAIQHDVTDFIADRDETGSQLAQAVREQFVDRTSRADRLARELVEQIYNLAQLEAVGIAGTESVQVLAADGEVDIGVGAIVSLSDARAMNGPGVAFRPLKQTVNIVRAPTEDGLLARYDQPSSTILLDADISVDDEQAYLLSVGEVLAA